MKEKAYLGVDPGEKSGAVALITNGFVDIMDWEEPIAMNEQLAEWNEDQEIQIVIIEKVWSMPGMNAKAMSSLMQNFGMWQGLMISNRVPYELVAPVTWQKQMLKNVDGNSTKEKSLTKARALFPSYANKYLKRKKDHNRADALLMARYGQMNY